MTRQRLPALLALLLASLAARVHAETWVVLSGPHAGTEFEADADGAVDEEQNETTNADGEVVDGGDGEDPHFVGSLFDAPPQDHGPVKPAGAIPLGVNVISTARMRVLDAWAGVETDPAAAKEKLTSAVSGLDLLLSLIQGQDVPAAVEKKLEKAREAVQELLDAVCAVIEAEPCEDDPHDRNDAWIALWGDVDDALARLAKAFEAAIEAAE